MSTFPKKITYMSSVLDGHHMVKKEVTKVATFKELDRLDKNQHKLHFMILSLYQNRVKDEGEIDDPSVSKIKLDSGALYDLTVKSIRTLILCAEKQNEEMDAFVETDKAEFLNDSVAILNFGLWFLENHISPFFLNLNPKLKTPSEIPKAD